MQYAKACRKSPGCTTGLAAEARLGSTHNRFTVVGALFKRGGHWQVPVACSCGNALSVDLTNLVRGKSKSCGCLPREKGRGQKLPVGAYKSRTYVAWTNMVQRCTNPNSTAFESYGGRGIAVCARWRSFANFLADMGNPPSDAYSLERLKHGRGYCKSNCCWLLTKHQSRNKRSTFWVRFRGEKMSLAAAAEAAGLGYHVVYRRLRVLGWSASKALETPVRKLKARPYAKSRQEKAAA